MPYLPTAVLVALGLVLLVLVVVRTLGAVRRFTTAAAMVNGRVSDEAGVIRARSAAVSVAVAQRRGRSVHGEQVTSLRGSQEDDLVQ